MPPSFISSILGGGLVDNLCIVSAMLPWWNEPELSPYHGGFAPKLEWFSGAVVRTELLAIPIQGFLETDSRLDGVRLTVIALVGNRDRHSCCRHGLLMV